MTTFREFVSADELRSALDYDVATGIFRWKFRDDMQRKWNLKHAGRIAGHTEKRLRYVSIRLNKVSFQAHRLAWLYFYGEWPTGPIDHINRDPADNRITNLRVADVSENARNRIAQKNNSSGFKGVCFERCTGKWRAQIVVRGHHHSLGRYDSAEEAAAAYRIAATQFHGEFARIE